MLHKIFFSFCINSMCSLGESHILNPPLQFLWLSSSGQWPNLLEFWGRRKDWEKWCLLLVPPSRPWNSGQPLQWWGLPGRKSGGKLDTCKADWGGCGALSRKACWEVLSSPGLERHTDGIFATSSHWAAREGGSTPVGPLWRAGDSGALLLILNCCPHSHPNCF